MDIGMTYVRVLLNAIMGRRLTGVDVPGIH
jgi:hypothetical protein